jgi:hypothetical protein
MGTQSLSEKIYFWIAWKLPRKLVYWCTIRLMAHATQTAEGIYQEPNEISIFNMLDRWNREIK